MLKDYREGELSAAEIISGATSYYGLSPRILLALLEATNQLLSDPMPSFQALQQPFGAHGPLGFAELRRAVEGISDSVLSERLSELCSAGLVLREVESGPPVMVRYRLTPAGEALAPILRELAAWASCHLPQSPPAAQRGGTRRTG